MKYFVKGTETSNFNLNIVKRENSDLYSLTWTIGDNCDITWNWTY